MATKVFRKAFIGMRKKEFKDFQKSTSPITRKSLVSRAVYHKIVSRRDVMRLAQREGDLDFKEGETRVKDIVAHYFPGEES